MSDKEASPPRSRSRSVGSVGDSRKGSKSRSRSRSRRSYRSRSYKRSYSRSRSRSHSRGRRYRSRSRSPYYGGGGGSGGGSRRRSKYSRSRSRSPYSRRGSRYSPDEYGSRGRYRSRSPMSRRKRHDNPTTSRCIGVFGLSLYTQERDLREVFNRYGPIEEVQVVYDHQTGRSRGFAFIYYRNTEDAEEAKERAPGTEIDGHKIRVDYSITERAHTPTPGIYLGKPTGRESRYGGSGGGGGGGGRSRGDDYYRRRSPSPYYSRRNSRYSRSRSRSYSPRSTYPRLYRR